MMRIIFLLLTSSLLLSGCGKPTPPSRFYMLSPVASLTASDIAGQKTLVGITPAVVAPYIDRSQMVIRSSENQLSLSELDKWAEPLEDNISSVIAANLNRQLAAVQVLVDSPRRLPTSFRIDIRILRFDSNDKGHVRLQAQWSITDVRKRDDKNLGVHDADISVQAASATHADIVIGMSEAIGELSEEMAQQFSTLISEP